MKVVHLASELTGGAGLAALRLHRAELGEGMDSHLAYMTGDTDVDQAIKYVPGGSSLRRYGDRFLDQLLWNRRQPGTGLISRPRRLCRDGVAGIVEGADIVHLHWIAKWLDWPTLFSAIPKSVPIVVTLHDAGFFTGGCHQTNECRRFEHGCGCCPMLRFCWSSDFSARGYVMRERLYSGRKITAVPVSAWMQSHASRAALLQPHKLHSPIFPGADIEAFKPLDRNTCRDILRVPKDRFIISAGSADLADSNKGMSLLIEAIQLLPAAIRKRVGLLLYGSGVLPKELNGVPVYQAGFVASERLLSVVYSASDVYCTPSQMETFGMTAVEAAACAVPVVAFATGGLAEIVRHGENGWSVPLVEASGGIAVALEDAYSDIERRLEMGAAAREYVSTWFSIQKAAGAYAELYRSLI